MKQLLVLTVVYIINVGKTLRSLFWPIRILLSKTISLSVTKNQKFQFVTYGEITRRLYSGSFLVNFGKEFEHRTISQFVNYIKEGDTVFDIGANIGMYSLLASRLLGPQGKVYSFEPVEETFKSLEKNIQINRLSNVECLKYALSDSDGTAAIDIPPENLKLGDGDAFNSLQLDEPNPSGNIVETIKLDTFINLHNISKVDFMKIDIEGAELLFFKGAIQTIKKLRPKTIIFEAYDPFCKRFNYSVADIIVLLHSLDYSLEQYADNQWLAISR